MGFVQGKQRELISPVCSAAITLSVVAMGTTAGLSQPTSFDGFYKGSLECEQGGLEGIRMPLAVSIHDGRLIWSSSSLDLHGRDVAPEVVRAGTVKPDGTFHVDYIEYTSKYTTHVNYSGTLDGTGGTLTGTQISTPEITEDAVTRTCKGTFLRVERPKH